MGRRTGRKAGTGVVSMTLLLCPHIAPSGYWPRKLGGWCVYEGCQVKHAEGYDNERCPMHRRLKNATNREYTRRARKWRRVQLGWEL